MSPAPSVQNNHALSRNCTVARRDPSEGGGCSAVEGSRNLSRREPIDPLLRDKWRCPRRAPGCAYKTRYPRESTPLGGEGNLGAQFPKELKSRPLQTHAVNLANQIKRFSAEARRYVDDESVSQPAPLTKEEYETQLKEAGNTVMKLAGMVSAHERKPEQTAATLIPFFNERLLKSNLIPILARVQGEGALRAKHRIPPGFFDVATFAEDGDVPNKGKAANESANSVRFNRRVFQHNRRKADIRQMPTPVKCHHWKPVDLSITSSAHSFSIKHLGFMSKRPARFSSSSRHNMAPILMRSHLWASVLD